MSRVYLTEPEPARRVPARIAGAAMTSEAQARAFIERVMGKRTDDDAPIVVPDDEPEQVDDEPELEPVEDEPAETLEAGLNHTGGTLYGVSSEDLAGMRARQAEREQEKRRVMRAWRG